MCIPHLYDMRLTNITGILPNNWFIRVTSYLSGALPFKKNLGSRGRVKNLAGEEYLSFFRQPPARNFQNFRSIISPSTSFKLEKFESADLRFGD